MSDKAHLTRGSVTVHLINLAVPSLIGIICTFSFVIADTYFISLISQNSLIAISYATPMIDFIIGIAIGLGIAISSVVSRQIGAGDFEKVKVYLLHASALCFLLSIIISVAGIFSIDAVFTALGADHHSLPEIYRFMAVWYIGVFFLFMTFIMSNALRAYGQAKGPAIVQVLMAVINILLDPILIFVFQWHITGAAIAGLIARLIGFALLMKYLISAELITFKVRHSLQSLLHSWQKMVAIAIPASLTNIIGPLATFWMTYLLAKTSQQAVAGFGIASKVQMVAVIPLFVLSASIGPVVGQNFAARQLDRAWFALKQCNRFSVIWGASISIILLIIAPYIASIFTDDDKIISVSNLYLYIVPISYIGWGIIMMVNASFNALGHPRRSLIISIIRMGILFLPFSYLLSIWFSFTGVFIAFTLSTFITAFIAYQWALKHYQQEN